MMLSQHSQIADEEIKGQKGGKKISGVCKTITLSEPVLVPSTVLGLIRQCRACLQTYTELNVLATS